MSSHLFTFPAIIMLALLCAACHKDPISPVPYYASILTTGQWRLYAYWRYVRENTGRVDTVNEFAAMPPCETDNEFTFKITNQSAGGDMLIDEGPTKCDSSLPQQPRPMWWNIPYESGNTFIINDGNMANFYSLDYLSDSVLRLSQGEGYDPMRGTVEGDVLVYRRLR